MICGEHREVCFLANSADALEKKWNAPRDRAKRFVMITFLALSFFPTLLTYPTSSFRARHAPRNMQRCVCGLHVEKTNIENIKYPRACEQLKKLRPAHEN